MSTQQEKAHRFAELHRSLDVLVMPNAWDAGTAKTLTSLGFGAIATTSAGLAHSLGREDNRRAIAREEALANAADICAATPLPVSADLENCYADDLEGIAQTIRLAADAGLCGCSIEDATGNPDGPIYPLDVAVARVKAAVDAANTLPFPFILTARAENFLQGREDIDDTIRRLQAYDRAGAHVLYAPFVDDVDQLKQIVTNVSKPVNALKAGPFADVSVADLHAAGARRISIGSALYNKAMSAFKAAAAELAESLHAG